MIKSSNFIKMAKTHFTYSIHNDNKHVIEDWDLIIFLKQIKNDFEKVNKSYLI